MKEFRLIKADTMGFCMGVRRAMDTIEELRAEHPDDRISTYGPLIHNPSVLDRLKESGIEIIGSPEEATDGFVVIRAHGVSPQEIKKLEGMNVEIVDGTCPRVLKSQEHVDAASKNGMHVVIVGDLDHGEVKGLSGHAETSDIVRTAEDAEMLDLNKDTLVIAQTTIREDEFLRVCSVLQQKCAGKGIRLEERMTICPAARKRQSSLQKLIEQTEAIVIIGGKNSANTRRLYTTTLDAGLPCWHIETKDELPPEVFQYSTIGITAGASTPDWIIEEVEEYIYKEANMKNLRAKKAFICDMDGVIYHGNKLLPGVKEFVAWLREEDKKFLFLTNGSQRSPLELQQKLARLGVEVEKEHFYTSALATAGFLAQQQPGGSAFVIGEAGLINALYDAGLTMNDVNPDYVVVGESKTYNMEMLEHAVNLVVQGAKLVGTNPDLTGPIENGITPATGALMAPIELATGNKAYYVGKPNPLMMRQAMKRLEAKREDTVIVGDRMDTDIISGIESEIETVLVLSGVTDEKEMVRFAYRPGYILDGVGDIPTLQADKKEPLPRDSKR
ncbi:MAG: 4-hydroxy-3-methylbut-2-enyl diphosphate reductase [Spirochaetales bacterium]|nr:4-hydroxy-3-methylbut-2-enyl diphosphate reductase [Spirochaetales bacterium]